MMLHRHAVHHLCLRMPSWQYCVVSLTKVQLYMLVCCNVTG